MTSGRRPDGAPPVRPGREPAARRPAIMITPARRPGARRTAARSPAVRPAAVPSPGGRLAGVLRPGRAPVAARTPGGPLRAVRRLGLRRMAVHRPARRRRAGARSPACPRPSRPRRPRRPSQPPAPGPAADARSGDAGRGRTDQRGADVHRADRTRRHGGPAQVRCARGGDDRPGDRGVGLGRQHARRPGPQPVRHQGHRSGRRCAVPDYRVRERPAGHADRRVPGVSRRRPEHRRPRAADRRQRLLRPGHGQPP